MSGSTVAESAVGEIRPLKFSGSGLHSMSAEQDLGYSIQIFVAGGDSAGLRIVEKTNWNGIGLICPRSSFAKVKKRPEFQKAGVYALIGPAESSELPKTYIGEGDPVLPRLEQHHAEREFWTNLVFFHSKDQNLNKAHIQYLESRLVAIATEAKRCQLENGNIPALPSLSEAATAECEGFLEEMLLCFPVIGVSFFEIPPAAEIKVAKLFLETEGIKAEGYESEDGFVVVAGSRASTDEAASIEPRTKSIREALKERGILLPDGDSLRLTQDYTFNSPSLAASVFAANNISGREWWKDDQGRTLRQLQQEEAES